MKNFQFLIGTGTNGFYAVSNTEPFFCLHGSTQQEAIDNALKAWKLFLHRKGRKSNPKVTSSTKCEAVVFTPKDIITAEA